jgi:hypothetical protein
MIQVPQASGYSSEVELSLELPAGRLPLAKIGPDRITLCKSYSAPAGPATIVMRVDGHETRWRVRLVEGLHEDSCFARIERLSCETAPDSVEQANTRM